MFQSLLLQVSFKTSRAPLRKNYLVSIPSPSGLLQNNYLAGFTLRPRFNPFSFRSPSKQSGASTWRCDEVSNPSPSGLLQNAFECTTARWWSFNPFSFRSPSKPVARQRSTGAARFQSLLLQVSFKTDTVEVPVVMSVSIPSPSGLLQNI